MRNTVRVMLLAIVLLRISPARAQLDTRTPCDPGRQPAGVWTLDTLYLYLSDRIDELDRRIEQKTEAQHLALRAALDSAQQAIDKANVATEKRFDSVNEWRKSYGDLTEKYMPRQESMNMHSAAREKLEALSARIDKMEGQKSGTDSSWLFIVGAISTIGVLVSVYAVVSTSRHHNEDHGDNSGA